MHLCWWGNTYLTEDLPELVPWNGFLLEQEVNNLVHGHSVFPTVGSTQGTSADCTSLITTLAHHDSTL